MQRPIFEGILPIVDPHDETLCWMYRNVARANLRTSNLNNTYERILPWEYDALYEKYGDDLPDNINSLQGYRWFTISHIDLSCMKYLIINIFYDPRYTNEFGALMSLDYYMPGAQGQAELFVATNYTGLHEVHNFKPCVSWNNVRLGLFNAPFYHINSTRTFNSLMRIALDVLISRYLRFPITDNFIFEGDGRPIVENEDWVPEYFDLIKYNLEVARHTPCIFKVH